MNFFDRFAAFYVDCAPADTKSVHHISTGEPKWIMDVTYA
jgi:hypothetical protein